MTPRTTTIHAKAEVINTNNQNAPNATHTQPKLPYLSYINLDYLLQRLLHYYDYITTTISHPHTIRLLSVTKHQPLT